MKLVWPSIFALTVLTSLSTTALAEHWIQCKGFVSFKNGTMEGQTTVTFRQAGDESWYLDLGSGYHIPAGMNQSQDAQELRVSNYHFWRSVGAEAQYNYERRELQFRYKYDSGSLGGGVQRTEGQFTDCQHQ